MITLYNPSCDLPKWIRKYKEFVVDCAKGVESLALAGTPPGQRLALETISHYTNVLLELERLYREGRKTNDYEKA